MTPTVATVPLGSRDKKLRFKKIAQSVSAIMDSAIGNFVSLDIGSNDILPADT